jgi:uncharacterized membrane protein YdjX (TVP38/TMEM64 family)
MKNKKSGIDRDSFSEALLDSADVEDAAAYEFDGSQIQQPKKSFWHLVLRIIRRKRFILAVLLILFAIPVFILHRQGYLTPENIFLFLKLYPTAAPLLFVLIYAIMVVFLLPTLPLNLGAGLLWGPVEGCILTVIAVSLGAVIAFLFSRYLAADYINQKFDGRAWRWLQKEMEKGDWKVVAFTRINPIFPSGPLNYFFGLTPISFSKYFIATVIFIAPAAFLFAYIGHSMGQIFLNGASYEFVKNLIIISVVITVLIVLRIVMKRMVHFNKPPQ